MAITDDFLMTRGLVGGAMLGASAAILYGFHGRIAGISGIFGGLLRPRGDVGWRALFVVTLVATGALVAAIAPAMIGAPVQASLPMVAIAGFLVGIGTRLGSGCTSGHGICGLSRLSLRSLVATMTFVGSGAAAVVIMRVLGIGAGA